jgi:hypothetical protein
MHEFYTFDIQRRVVNVFVETSQPIVAVHNPFEHRHTKQLVVVVQNDVV